MLRILTLGALALSLTACRNSGPPSVPVADLQARLAAHSAWLAAGGCKPGSDGFVNREDPSVATDPIGKLQPASLFRANLRGADLSNRDLRCLTFIGADLSGASFFGSDLRGAFFNRATLADANLERTDLRGTVLYNADVERMIYQPKQAPTPGSLALTKNLEGLTYDDDPTLLYAAKNSLKERGYVDAQKRVIAALRRSHPPEDNQESTAVRVRYETARALQTVLFDWTCEFGANSFRPLLVIFVLWLVCGMIYSIPLLRTLQSGLYLVSTGERIPKGKRQPHVFRLRARSSGQSSRLRSAFSTGLFFSFRRTFHFGFKELDFGNWMKLLQGREFEIRTYGWPRVVSGAQSILSIYLLALAILTAFTTPFDL